VQSLQRGGELSSLGGVGVGEDEASAGSGLVVTQPRHCQPIG